MVAQIEIFNGPLLCWIWFLIRILPVLADGGSAAWPAAPIKTHLQLPLSSQRKHQPRHHETAGNISQFESLVYL